MAKKAKRGRKRAPASPLLPGARIERVDPDYIPLDHVVRHHQIVAKGAEATDLERLELRALAAETMGRMAERDLKAERGDRRRGQLNSARKRREQWEPMQTRVDELRKEYPHYDARAVREMVAAEFGCSVSRVEHRTTWKSIVCKS